MANNNKVDTSQRNPQSLESIFTAWIIKLTSVIVRWHFRCNILGLTAIPAALLTPCSVNFSHVSCSKHKSRHVSGKTGITFETIWNGDIAVYVKEEILSIPYPAIHPSIELVCGTLVVCMYVYGSSLRITFMRCRYTVLSLLKSVASAWLRRGVAAAPMIERRKYRWSQSLSPIATGSYSSRVYGCYLIAKYYTPRLHWLLEEYSRKQSCLIRSRPVNRLQFATCSTTSEKRQAMYTEFVHWLTRRRQWRTNVDNTGNKISVWQFEKHCGVQLYNSSSPLEYDALPGDVDQRHTLKLSVLTLTPRISAYSINSMQFVHTVSSGWLIWKVTLS